MITGRLSALVLAAGLSRRMGCFKPLMPLGPMTVIERVLRLYCSAGIDDVCVVVGHRAEEIRNAVSAWHVRTVLNPNYESGMYSSLVAGLAALPETCAGFFVHPVDLPLVRTSTVAALMDAFSQHSDRICHPTFGGRRGHPPLVPGALAPAIRDWRGEGGLRAFWDTRPTELCDVPVADESILLDLDTKADCQRLMDRLTAPDLPTPAECHQLMQTSAKPIFL